MTGFGESAVEDAALAWLEALGYAVFHSLDIAAGEPRTERCDPDYQAVELERRLREVLLPKLMSGELRMRKAERFSERVGA